MKTNKVRWIFLSLLIAFQTGCNRGGSTASVEGGGYGALATTCTSYSANAVYDPARATCVDPVTGQVFGPPTNSNYISFYSQAWDASDYTSFNAVYNYNYYAPRRNMTIVNATAYRNFLKNAMSVCDAGQSNYGTASCNAWVSGGLDLVFQSSVYNPNALVATFRSWPTQSSAIYGYSGSFPSVGQLLAQMFGFPVFSRVGAYRNPLALTMQVSPINNSQGFEARGYGDFYTNANTRLVQIQVAKGKLQDNTFEHQIAFEGQIFAKGHFKRCVQDDCGTRAFFGN